MGNGNIKIEWNSVSGVSTYKVYLSAEEYGPYMSWSLMYTGSATDWTHDIDCEDYDFMYYKVAYISGTDIIETDPVGFHNVTVTKNAKNTLSCPFWLPDNTVSGDFGDQVLDNLEGASTSPDAPKIRIWDYDNQGWGSIGDYAWLHDVPKEWRSNTDLSVKPGDAFELEIPLGSGEILVTFLGYVPQHMGTTFFVGESAGGHKSGFANAYPVSATLNDIPFIHFGATGATSSANADKIVAPTNYSTGWTTLFWLRDDGVWMDGGSAADDSDIGLGSGKAYYYQKVNSDKKAIVIKKPY